MRRPKFSWNDYFTATPVTTFSQVSYNYRQTPSDSNVYILDCLFSAIASANSGGALYSTSNYLLIESSSFFSCKTSSGDGGAIYFANTSSGECVLHSVCGYDCNSASSSNGQFARIYVQNTASSKSFVNYSSITRCVNEASGAYKTLRHNNGKVCFQSTNVSMNKCYYRSVMYCYPYAESSSVTCSLLYSTFADNDAKGYTCIRFNRGGAKYEIKCCNIIRNTQGDLSSWGTFYINGNLMIEDSCILENKANYTFYSSSCAITLSNCTVYSTNYYGILTIQNTVTKDFIHALNHMSTHYCHADYNSVPTKKEICYTCKNHYQAIINDIFTLIYMFIVTFINPEPSGDF
jgi:hypothetical protein